MGKHVKVEYDCKELRETIKQKGITQREFANMVGVTENTIAHVLGGFRKPSVTLNKMICVVLGVPEDEFFIKPEPPKPELFAEEVAVDNTAVTAVNEATDKLLVYLERMERKQDRQEMLIRSVQNENLKLHQEILKLKAK